MSNKDKAPNIVEGLMNLLNHGYFYNPLAGIFNKDKRDLRKHTNYIHGTRKGPGRSTGVNIRVVRTGAGTKLAKLVTQGRLGLRGRSLSGASLLAQQGKL